MKSDDPNSLLFIEPEGVPSPSPVEDELTEAVNEEINQAEIRKNYVQHRGFYTCKGEGCRASSSRIYTLSNGMSTHAMAPHYLAYHRDEVPEGELEKAKQLL